LHLAHKSSCETSLTPKDSIFTLFFSILKAKSYSAWKVNLVSCWMIVLPWSFIEEYIRSYFCMLECLKYGTVFFFHSKALVVPKKLEICRILLNYFFSCWEENSNFSYSLFCNFLLAYCLIVLLFIHFISNEASLTYNSTLIPWLSREMVFLGEPWAGKVLYRTIPPTLSRRSCDWKFQQMLTPMYVLSCFWRSDD